MHYFRCNHALQFLQIFFSCFPDFLRRGPCVRHRQGRHSTWKPFHVDQVFHILDHNHTCHISHGHGLDHTHAFHIQHGSNSITHTNVFDFSSGPSAIKVTHFTNSIPLLLISPNPEPKPKTAHAFVSPDTITNCLEPVFIKCYTGGMSSRCHPGTGDKNNQEQTAQHTIKTQENMGTKLLKTQGEAERDSGCDWQ